MPRHNPTVVPSLIAIALAVAAGALASGCGSSDSKRSAVSNISCPTSSAGCSESQLTEYGNCIADACDAQYQACFGSTYRTGTFGGPCGTYYNCLAKCSCSDNNCRTACGVAPADCQLCIGNMITACVASSSCNTPTCGLPDGSAPLTCADLMQCCAAITDATQKMTCQLEYQMSTSYGDVVCNSFVRAFKTTGACP